METLGDWIDVAPWKSRLLMLMQVCDDDGALVTASTLGEKRELLANRDGIMVAVWPGEWKTTAREFAPGDETKVAERLG